MMSINEKNYLNVVPSSIHLEDRVKDLEDRFEYLNDKINNNNNQLSEFRCDINNLKDTVNKNISITESNNLQSAKTTILLENLTESIREIKIDNKEINSKVNKIDVENSKNTDTRLNTKQICVSVFISILMLLIGASLALAGVPK